MSLGRAPDLRRADTGLRSAAIGFLVPETTGTLERLDDTGLWNQPDVLEAELTEPGRQVRAAGSNNEYLGHVMAGDTEGAGARDRVEGLLAALRPGLVIR